MAQTVLVVDDDPLLRLCMTETVIDCGVDVVAAENADHALETLTREPMKFSALITDVRMPGAIDGVDLARIVARAWPHIRILVASGFDAGRRSELPRSARFLPKPWHAPDLISFISQY